MKGKEVAVANEPEANGGGLNLQVLIAQVVEQKADVSVIERLLTVRKELADEAARHAFNEAMAQFQADCPMIVKKKEVKNNNGALLYKYAPLDSIVSQVRECIRTNGFRYVMSMAMDDKSVTVTCRVYHRFGHFEESVMPVPLGEKTSIMSNSQHIAAAQTFAKRYAFCNAFGIITADDDNDGVAVGVQLGKSNEIDRQVKAILSCKTLKQLKEVGDKCDRSNSEVLEAGRKMKEKLVPKAKGGKKAAAEEKVAPPDDALGEIENLMKED